MAQNLSVQPTSQTLNTFSKATFIETYASLFEHSPWVVEAVADMRPFHSAQDMLDAMMQSVLKAPYDKRQALISAHPELGEKIKNIPLTHESRAEQGSAGLDHMEEHEYTLFHDLNRQYRALFGMPFIICVRNHSRNEIINALQYRLHNTKEQEEHKALEEIGMIAAHRLALHLNAQSDSLSSAISEKKFTLSTHVLDTAGGKPAFGIHLALWHCESKIFEGTTNRDGRCPELTQQTGNLTPGLYRLVFRLGHYFQTEGYSGSTAQPFLDRITIEFDTSACLIDIAATSHYHVPLLVSPYGYSTYRGS